MKDRSPAEASSGPVFGRGLVIALVTVFSGLSLTLGFFVGRSTVSEKAAMPQPVETSQVQEKSPVQPLQQPAQAPEPQQTIQAQPAPPAESPDMRPKTEPAAITPKTGPEQQKPEPKNTAKQPAPAPVVKTAREIPERTTAKTEAPQETGGKNPSYTVQLGAFKNPADARQLKAKIEKKGYKVFISADKDSKGHKVYKVRTGDYKDKKEAEVHAIKLRKADDIKTFVTTKAD